MARTELAGSEAHFDESSRDLGGLEVVDEAYKQEDGWTSRHFLLRRPSA